MKNLIKKCLLLAAVMLSFLPSVLQAITLSEIETRLMNDISRYIDVKPEGQALSFFEHAIRSKSVALKGLASIIMARHYGRRFQAQFLRNFTLNPELDEYPQEKMVLVKLENVEKLLAAFRLSLEKLNDERVRRLFLFFHFRHKNVWLLGQAGEELSLAAFYRISVFNELLGATVDPIKLAAQADRR